jgi:hypothetical protein
MERRLKVDPTGLADSRLPVFVSRPLRLTAAQTRSLKVVVEELRRLGLEPRTYGAQDYPIDNPVSAARAMARICCGGVVLGFRKYDVPRTSHGTRHLSPSPWNHLEGGILIGLGLPVWILREGAVSGGIFGDGSSDVFIHPMPRPGMSKRHREHFQESALKYSASVREYYYRK